MKKLKIPMWTLSGGSDPERIAYGIDRMLAHVGLRNPRPARDVLLAQIAAGDEAVEAEEQRIAGGRRGDRCSVPGMLPRNNGEQSRGFITSERGGTETLSTSSGRVVRSHALPPPPERLAQAGCRCYTRTLRRPDPPFLFRPCRCFGTCRVRR